jgi:hypothetical protein
MIGAPVAVDVNIGEATTSAGYGPPGGLSAPSSSTPTGPAGSPFSGGSLFGMSFGEYPSLELLEHFGVGRDSGQTGGPPPGGNFFGIPFGTPLGGDSGGGKGGTSAGGGKSGGETSPGARGIDWGDLQTKNPDLANVLKSSDVLQKAAEEFAKSYNENYAKTYGQWEQGRVGGGNSATDYLAQHGVQEALAKIAAYAAHQAETTGDTTLFAQVAKALGPILTSDPNAAHFVQQYVGMATKAGVSAEQAYSNALQTLLLNTIALSPAVHSVGSNTFTPGVELALGIPHGTSVFTSSLVNAYNTFGTMYSGNPLPSGWAGWFLSLGGSALADVTLTGAKALGLYSLFGVAPESSLAQHVFSLQSLGSRFGLSEAALRNYVGWLSPWQMDVALGRSLGAEVISPVFAGDVQALSKLAAEAGKGGKISAQEIASLLTQSGSIEVLSQGTRDMLSKNTTLTPSQVNQIATEIARYVSSLNFAAAVVSAGGKIVGGQALLPDWMEDFGSYYAAWAQSRVLPVMPASWNAYWRGEANAALQAVYERIIGNEPSPRIWQPGMKPNDPIMALRAMLISWQRTGGYNPAFEVGVPYSQWIKQYELPKIEPWGYRPEVTQTPETPFTEIPSPTETPPTVTTTTQITTGQGVQTKPSAGGTGQMSTKEIEEIETITADSSKVANWDPKRAQGFFGKAAGYTQQVVQKALLENMAIKVDKSSGKGNTLDESSHRAIALVPRTAGLLPGSVVEVRFGDKDTGVRTYKVSDDGRYITWQAKNPFTGTNYTYRFDTTQDVSSAVVEVTSRQQAFVVPLKDAIGYAFTAAGLEEAGKAECPGGT